MNFSLRSLLLFLLLVNSVSAQSSASFSFNLPAQPLSSTLNSLANVTGIKLIYADEITQNKLAPPLQGDFTLAEALNRILNDNQLSYELVDNSMVAIKPNAPVPARLPEITVRSDLDPDSPYNTRYSVSEAVTATKTNTPIMETPFSVQVVPRQVLQDRQSFRLEDALRNVSGVTFLSPSTLPQDSSVIRGFSTSSTYRNGVFFPLNNFVEMANVERVEVLKGPGSILFGRADPGGIINTVTKQPLATPYYSLQQQAGSFDFYRTAVDATGPLTANGALLYRMNLSYENSGSFQDEAAHRKTVFFTPVVRWNISPQTQITAEMEYLSFNTPQFGGIPILGTRPAPLPRNAVSHEPHFNKWAGDRYFGGINWSHQFNENWQISNRLSIHHYDIKQNKGVFPFSVATPNGDIDRFAMSAPFRQTDYQSMLNLTGNITTGILEHKLLFGYDYYYQDFFQASSICCPSEPINIFNHTFLTAPPDSIVNPNPNDVFGKSESATSWHGAYFQDQVKLPFNLHAMGGFRYDYATSRDKVADETTGKDDRFSPRGGLLWQPVEWLSLYGSYTENFGVSNGIDSNRRKLPPETAQQWETGLKTEFFGGRLRSTFSYFELTKQGIAVPDPSNPRFSRAIGEAETRGIELDVSGEILPGWNIIATYSYLPFAKITKDHASIFDENGESVGTNSGNEGNRLPFAAKHMGSLWNTYEFRNELLRGLKIGGGIQATGERQSSAENIAQLSTFVIGNLMASYQIKTQLMRITAQLNVHNVSDEKYFENATSFSALYGAPRTFMGMLRIEH